MHLYIYPGQNEGEENNHNTFSRISASISEGEATIKRRIIFEADNIDEDAADIMSLAVFPQKNSSHPRHPNFIYRGNCTISPVSDRSKHWIAELDYINSNSNKKDQDGNTVTEDTQPWKLLPESVSIAPEEETVPFVAGYSDRGNLFDESGNFLHPVTNSAGDPIKAEKVSLNRVLSFSYSLKANAWQPEFSMYQGSINSSAIKIAGYSIPAKTAIIQSLSPEFITVYDDDGRSVKWQYWKIAVSIRIDENQSTILRKFLDIGNRAKFSEISLAGDALLGDAEMDSAMINACPYPTQICRFRKTKNIGTDESPMYAPIGDVVFCGWDQFLVVIRRYQRASQILMRKKKPLLTEVYQPECEQLEQMPLNNGYLHTVQKTGGVTEISTSYRTLEFRDHPIKNWSSLNFPKKGV